MTGFVIFIHTIICVFLLLIILMQSGRGGGLTEGFSSTENMFGAQTNTVLIKVTTVLAVLYFVTCLSLAILSTTKGKSIMPNQVATELPDVSENLDASSEVLVDTVNDTSTLAE
jgi:preprotein translocase subunit SecG